MPFNIESVEELTLGANLAMSQLERLKWKTKEELVSDTGKSLILILS